MAEEICTCGHSHKDHIISSVDGVEFCVLCCADFLEYSDFEQNAIEGISLTTNYQHIFKLDNLRFIEDLAKERKLYD
jgi:hypothetical protein